MIGTRLANRYEIAAELGRGGMGFVYLPHDPLLNRDVAVKLIPPTQLGPESEQRFQREAQVVAQMDHPAIVQIYDFGRHDDSLFFVMALVQGTSLRAFLRQESRLGDIVDVGIQVAEALEYSHTRGVVHRDIKPENVMVAREEGLGVRVRVMDFGLARAATEHRLTRTGTLLGTLGYLSPEQITAKDVDGRADIYALGTMLYECLTGEPPFAGEAQAVVYRIVHEFPQPPRAIGVAVDEELETLVMACLAKSPAERPQRAGEVAEALRRYRTRMRDSDRSRTFSGVTRSYAADRPAASPFVGRAKDLAALQQRLNAALAGECQFVVVGGEPGIGKTRLLDEVEALARARQVRVLHGRSIEQDRAFPYQGFCDVIQESFRQRDTGSGPVVDLSDLAADLVTLFPMLTEIPEMRSAGSGPSSIARQAAGGPENRTQVFELLARTLTRLAGGRPLMLLLEDLHQAEVSIEALQYIVRRLGPTPTLIVGTYRSTELDTRHPLTRLIEGLRGDRRFAHVALGPLSAAEHRSFLETVVGPGVSEALAHRLFEGSEGNPFFTRELVRSLVDSGAIARDHSGAWSLSAEAGLSVDVLPATIQQAVEKRIERLPDDLREVLSLASVMGRTFDSRDLESLSESDADLDDALDRLVSEGLVEEDRQSRGDRLVFSSGVVRDVLYSALSRRRRRSIHRRYAEVLERRHAGRFERALPQLLHHCSQGDLAEKTVEYGMRLARASLEAFSAEEAIRSARTALEFLDDEWEGDRGVEGDARLLLARGHLMAGDAEAALREASAAIRAFEAAGQPARASAAIALAADTAWRARRPDETSRFVDRGLVVAREAGDTDSLRQLLSLSATVANLRGQYDRAARCLEELAALAPGGARADTSEQVPRGGRLVIALSNAVEPQAPVGIRTIEEEEVLANAYETLVVSDGKGHVVGLLAASWETPDAGATFVVRLREGVRFHDGHPLAAADVKASIEYAVRRAARELPAAFKAIRGVQAFQEGRDEALAGIVVRGELDLEIQLAQPLPIYPALLSHERTAVVRVVHGAGVPGALVGTGPFRISSRADGAVVLERHDGYWRAGLPRLDALEFRGPLSATEIATSYRAGELDVARDLLPTDLDEALRDPVLRQGLAEAPRKNTYFILFNALSGPVARHASLRRALSGVIRTRDLVWSTIGRFAEPAVCAIPPGMLGHDPGRRTPTLAREEALDLLRECGLDRGVRLKAAVHPAFKDRFGALLANLFATWAELGVEVDVETAIMSRYLETWRDNSGLDLMVGRWNADYDDPDNFTHTLFHGECGQLRTFYSSPEADQLLEEARAENRPAAREALYRRFERLLGEGGVLVPLFHDIDYRLVSPRVHALTLRGTPPYVNFAEIGKSAAPRAAASGARAAAGALHLAFSGSVPSLDPALAINVEQGEVLPMVLESLTRDIGGARIVPWLAAEYRAHDGGRRFWFRLREDVRFHDGRRLGARDVRYSFERLLQAGGSQMRGLFAPMRGAKALIAGEARDLSGFQIHSATEFTIELEDPVVFFPATLTHLVAAILPEGSQPSETSIVGTGPFKIVRFEPGRRLEVERHRGYWRPGVPQVESVSVSFGVPPQDILAGFRAGRYSLANDLLPADLDALRREPEFAQSYRETPRLITYYLVFNMRRRAMADDALRKRIAEGLDVQRLVRQCIGRLAIPANGLIPPGLPGHVPVARSEQPPDAFGETVPGAIKLTLAMHPLFQTTYATFAHELFNRFAALGIQISPVTRTMDELLEAQRQGTVDLVLKRWSADYPDPDTFMHTLHSTEGHTGHLCGSPALDRLIERGRAEPNPVARDAIYRELEGLLAREARVVPLFHEQAYRLARRGVEGLSVSFGSPTVSYDELRVLA
jgi:ABC-type transport system substrate-binding protein